MKNNLTIVCAIVTLVGVAVLATVLALLVTKGFAPWMIFAILVTIVAIILIWTAPFKVYKIKKGYVGVVMDDEGVLVDEINPVLLKPGTYRYWRGAVEIETFPRESFSRRSFTVVTQDVKKITALVTFTWEITDETAFRRVASSGRALDDMLYDSMRGAFEQETATKAAAVITSDKSAYIASVATQWQTMLTSYKSGIGNVTLLMGSVQETK